MQEKSCMHTHILHLWLTRIALFSLCTNSYTWKKVTHHTLIIIMRFLKIKKGPQWTYFKPWGGGPSRPIQATVHRVAANTHGPPTNDSFWYTWRQDPLVSERHLRTTSHGTGFLYTCVFPQPLELQPRHTFALHWHLKTTSHRSRKHSCWFTLTHCFFRRTSKAKDHAKDAKILPTSGKSTTGRSQLADNLAYRFFIYIRGTS